MDNKNNRFEQSLRTVASTALESVFMMLISDDEFADLQADQKRSAASVSFAGPFRGQVFVQTDASMLPTLAANMLGVSDDGNDVTFEQQEDAMRELLNVICGNLLPVIAGADAVFNVGAPKNIPETVIPESVEGLQFAAETAMKTDCGKMVLKLFLDDPQKIAAAMPQS